MSSYFISDTKKSYNIVYANFRTVGMDWNLASLYPRQNPTGYHALYYRTDHSKTKAILNMSNTSVELLPDKIYFIPAFSIRSREIDGEIQKYFIHFQCDYIDFGLYQYVPDKCCVSANSLTKELFKVIVENFNKKTITSQQKVSGAMDMLLSDFMDNMAVQLKIVEKYKPVFTFIEKHYHEKITIEDLAKIMHFSTTYFLNNFKESFHITPKQYILGKRLVKSQYLLTETDMSVKEIAAKVGFENENYFSEYFSAKVGISALKFRNKTKNKAK